MLLVYVKLEVPTIGLYTLYFTQNDIRVMYTIYKPHSWNVECSIIVTHGFPHAQPDSLSKVGGVRNATMWVVTCEQ